MSFMSKRVAEIMAEAPPTIDLPNCKRKNVEQSTPSSLKKPKVLLRKFIKTFYPPPAVWYVSHLLLVDKIQLS